MSTTINLAVTMETTDCTLCGITFGLPTDWLARKRRTNENFYCPNGHTLHFPGETREQRRIRELEEKLAREARTVKALSEDLTVERGAREQVQRRLAATKGVVTRVRNRIANGVCPCCNRSFVNLQRHMNTQHPDWNPAAQH
jgi:uncharacterized coiled-coil protein SlyX